METILDNDIDLPQPSTPTPTQQILYFCLSRIFERGAYYGLRALLVLYMIEGTLQLPPEKALSIYGWVTTLILLGSILGAVLGDLVLGNKQAILVGSVAQALGALLLCIPSLNGLYAGLGLTVLGSGLYSPNLIANFGKSYLKHPKLMDAGFSWLHLAVNLGAFLGVLMLGYIGDNFGWQTGFACGAVLMLLSLAPILFTQAPSIPTASTTSATPSSNGLLMIFVAFLLSGIFWMIFEWLGPAIFNRQSSLAEVSNLALLQNRSNQLGALFTFVLCAVMALVWTFYYSKPLVKLALGFLLGALAYGAFTLLLDSFMEGHTLLFLVMLSFLSLASVHIAPILDAILTRYAAPKYLAIVMSLAFIPPRFFSYRVLLLGAGQESYYVEDGTISILVMGLVGLLLGILAWRQKRTS